MTRYDKEKFFLDPNGSEKQNLPFPKLSSDATVELSVIVPSYNEEQRCKCMMFVPVPRIFNVKQNLSTFNPVKLLQNFNGDTSTEKM